MKPITSLTTLVNISPPTSRICSLAASYVMKQVKINTVVRERSRVSTRAKCVIDLLNMVGMGLDAERESFLRFAFMIIATPLVGR